MICKTLIISLLVAGLAATGGCGKRAPEGKYSGTTERQAEKQGPAIAEQLLGIGLAEVRIQSNLKPGERLRSLCVLSRGYARLGNQKQALALLGEADACLAGLPPESKADTFYDALEIARSYGAAGDAATRERRVEELLEFARKTAPDYKPYVQFIARAYAETGDASKARQLEAELPDLYQDIVEEDIALALARSGRVTEAIALMEQLPDPRKSGGLAAQRTPWWRAVRISRLAEVPEAVRADAAGLRRALADASNAVEEAARKPDSLREVNIEDRSSHFARIAIGYAALGDVAEAERFLGKVSNTFLDPKHDVLLELAVAYGRAGQWAKADETLQQCNRSTLRFWQCQARIGKGCAQDVDRSARYFAEAIQHAVRDGRRSPLDFSLAALCDIAVLYAEAGSPGTAAMEPAEAAIQSVMKEQTTRAKFTKLPVPKS